MTYEPQVDRSHYAGGAYRSGERWISYYHQIELVRALRPSTLLEVGVGEGVVARELHNTGVAVTTVDIAPDLAPDVLGSVTELPFPDKSFDVVLAAEILEHITFDDVPKALHEIARVARHGAVISIPHPGYVFSIVYKVPLFPKIELYGQIPFFWQTHRFNGQHYWELGKKGYSISTFLRLAKEAGLTCATITKHADDPGHRFFLFKTN